MKNKASCRTLYRLDGTVYDQSRLAIVVYYALTDCMPPASLRFANIANLGTLPAYTS